MREERGSVTVFAVGMALVVLAVAGLAVDGARAMIARRSLQNAVDASVVAAAAELETDRYYASGGRQVLIDPVAAANKARRVLDQRGVVASVEIRADPNTVAVAASTEVQTSFLGAVGIDSIAVTVDAAAEPFVGP